MKAEILWVFETVISHSSLNSNRNKPPLFQTMFPRQWCGKAVSEMKASWCKCLVYNLWHRVACETKTHRRSLCCDLWLIAYHCNADKTNVCNSSFLEWTWRSSDCGISSTLVDNFERKLWVNLTCLTLCRSQWIDPMLIGLFYDKLSVMWKDEQLMFTLKELETAVFLQVHGAL